MRKIFVANRGEIAVRIIGAAHALGIDTVQAVSAADGDMLAARLAGATILVGPARAAKSYLNAEALIKAALESGSDAVHPGYGFLSENANFAEKVCEAGLIFIGPNAETIRRMGDKISARQYAMKAGVPVVPGSNGRVGAHDAAAVAEDIGFPLIIKASAGGGGRGIRVVHARAELAGQIALASTEAAAAFGDGDVYLERFIECGRHIEVQILGDGTNFIHLYERDCSVQRRRQKVWEEAPAGVLTTALREQLCASAVRLAKSVSYRGAGTVEYLYDDVTGAFFFIEMNTRIQVEHPITELVTGIDIIKEMIQIADGQPLSVLQAAVTCTGHAIECRINAEDPDANFAPSPGTVAELAVPTGSGIRFDAAIYEGYTIPTHYDSLLGKLIVWGENRPKALARLRQALGDMKVEGIATTLPLHRRLVDSAQIEQLQFHTNWLENWLLNHP